MTLVTQGSAKVSLRYFSILSHALLTLSPNLDRSLPPNEILQYIFELVRPCFSAFAVYQCPPYMLISKRCLPFLRSILFRHIDISSPKAVRRFSETLLSVAGLGAMIKTLEISAYRWIFLDGAEERRRETIGIARNLRRILYLTPQLESLTQFEWMDNISALPLIGVPLSNLRRLETAVPPVDDKILDLNDFAWIAALPSLTSLKLDFWEEYNECYVSPGVRFPLLQKLEIEGCGAADDSVGILASVCPSLIEVRLSTYSGSPSFEHCLPSFPLSLARLSISSNDGPSIPVDPLLLRFQQLTHIEVGRETASSSIHLTLMQLPNLVDVYLADGPWDLEGLQQLVEGSRRLRKLREFGFDYAGCHVEGRFDPEVAAQLESFRVETYVAFDHWIGDFNEWLRVQELVETCTRNGIKMEGQVVVTAGAIDAFILETYNLAIARTFYLSDSSTLQHAKNLATIHSFPLPHLDYDGTNLDDMSLVKIERKEQEWFTLTLRERTIWEQQRHE